VVQHSEWTCCMVESPPEQEVVVGSRNGPLAGRPGDLQCKSALCVGFRAIASPVYVVAVAVPDLLRGMMADAE
jgi:hypothetical protein